MFPNQYKNHLAQAIQNRGFGLVELLVTFSILVLVLGSVLVRQDSFNSAVLLRNEAYEIALHAREVQMYAVSILSSADAYRGVYGLYFDKTGTNKYSYKTYRDTDNDSYYSPAEEFGVQGKIDPRFEIGDIRIIDSSGAVNSRDYVAVIFQRPNFDARFFRGVGAGNEISNVSSLEVDLIVRSDSSKKRTIEITKTGQITVKTP